MKRKTLYEEDDEEEEPNEEEDEEENKKIVAAKLIGDFQETLQPIMNNCIMAIIDNDPNLNRDRLEISMLIALYTLTLVMDIGGHPDQAMRAATQACKELPNACKVALQVNQNKRSPKKKLEAIIHTAVGLIRRIVEKRLPDLTPGQREFIGRSLEAILTQYSYYPEDEEVKIAGGGCFNGGGVIPDNPFNTEWIGGGVSYLSGGDEFGTNSSSTFDFGSNSSSTFDFGTNSSSTFGTNSTPSADQPPDWNQVGAALGDVAKGVATVGWAQEHPFWTAIGTTLIPMAIQAAVPALGAGLGYLYNNTIRAKAAQSGSSWGVRAAKWIDDHLGKPIRSVVGGEKGRKRLQAVGNYLAQAVPGIAQDLIEHDNAVAAYNAKVIERAREKAYKETKATALWKDMVRETDEKNKDRVILNAKAKSDRKQQQEDAIAYNKNLDDNYEADKKYNKALDEHEDLVDAINYNYEEQMADYNARIAEFERTGNIKELERLISEKNWDKWVNLGAGLASAGAQAMGGPVGWVTGGLTAAATIAGAVKNFGSVNDARNNLQEALKSNDEARKTEAYARFKNEVAALQDKTADIRDALLKSGNAELGIDASKINTLTSQLGDAKTKEEYLKTLNSLQDSMGALTKNLDSESQKALKAKLDLQQQMIRKVADVATGAVHDWTEVARLEDKLEHIKNDPTALGLVMPRKQRIPRAPRRDIVEPVHRYVPPDLTEDELLKPLAYKPAELFAPEPVAGPEPVQPMQTFRNTVNYTRAAIPNLAKAWEEADPKASITPPTNLPDPVQKIDAGPRGSSSPLSVKTAAIPASALKRRQVVASRPLKGLTLRGSAPTASAMPSITPPTHNKNVRTQVFDFAKAMATKPTAPKSSSIPSKSFKMPKPKRMRKM